MTPKQKRAYRRAQQALLELGRVTFDDYDATNAACELTARALGAMLGTAAGAHMIGLEDFQGATRRAAEHVEKMAAESYGRIRVAARAGAPLH